MKINDIPGYFSGSQQTEMIRLLYKYNYPECVGVEVGCLHGRSSIAISIAINKGTLYCIDKWDGVLTYINDLSDEFISENKLPGPDNFNTLETFLKNTDTTFDCIYIDPSRRNEVKGKVFLLKDCLPNVPENIDFLFTKTAQILLKNSPILDISSVISELNFVKEVHIIALQNEVKEVLFLLEKNYKEEIQIKTINIRKEDFQRFDFKLKETVTSNYSAPLSYLYEPNAAILKSGAFHQVSKQLNVFKVHQHSHLYTSNEIIDFPGRVFKVENVIPYHKKKIKNFLSEDKANITIRNFPKTVNQIRKETKIKDGGNSYLFFTTLKNNELVVICCKKTG